MKHKLIIALACFATMSSCKKIIEIPETDLIGGDLALSQIKFVEQAVLGTYAGVSVDMNILLNSVFADEVAKGEFYNAVSTHEWQYGPADVGLRDSYTAIYPNYTIINRANLVLAALPNADSTAAGDEVKRIRLKGEALFLRAYAHFELFRYYSGNYDPNGLAMAYMESSSIAGTPRITMGPYFQKIDADLAAAKLLLPNNLTDISRANVAAVAGLQARVALYTRNWPAAEAFATEYIAAVPLANIATFPSIWTDASTAEQAFRIVKITSNPRIGSLYRGTSTAATNVGIGTNTWKPSDKLWISYNQANDIRFSSYLKFETILIAPREQRLVWKYAGGGYGSATDNVANGKVFRTGEMVLIRAEARAEQNKFTGANSAESDINLLRSNRINGYTNVTFATQQQAIDETIQERFKELAFEGHRFWDLKRRNLPVSRLPQDAVSPAGTTLAAGNFRFVLPIPVTEMTANPITQQNPGYQ